MFLCQTQVALTKMVLWFSIVIIVTVTITKFMFICVWKSMRTMNDNLMVRIAINQALLSSIVIGLLKFRPHVSSVLMLMFLYNIVLSRLDLLQVPKCFGARPKIYSHIVAVPNILC